jgi:hypothetical protein
MKAESIVLLIIAGVILYEASKKQAGGIQWINCDDPNADPVMCGLIQQ